MLCNDIPSILIVGAGPAGLTLANLFQHLGRQYRLIDQNEKPSKISKATGIHRNTLKLLSKIELTKEIVSRSIELNGNNLFVDGRLEQQIAFTQGVKPEDKNISIKQSTFEKILRSHLKSDNPSPIEWRKKLIKIKKNSDSIQVSIENIKTGDVEKICVGILIGADGAKSITRKLLGFSFEGERTLEKSFTFDAKISSNLSFPRNEMAMFSKGQERLVVVPLPKEVFKFSGRLINSSQSLKESDLPNLVAARSGLEIEQSSIKGLTCYHTSSKVVSCMHEKNIFLIGDAAHIFFPAGGYGLNTAIEDAFSLAWRLNFNPKNLNDLNKLFPKDFSEERLANALCIQNDSTQKKIQTEKTSFSNESGKVKEEQVYNQIHQEKGFVRMDSLFSSIEIEQFFSSITSRFEFACIARPDMKEYLQQFSQKLHQQSGIPCQVILAPSTLNLTIPDNSFYLIRPDNFAKCISLA